MAYLLLPIRLVLLLIWILAIIVSLLVVMPWLSRPAQKAWAKALARLCAPIVGIRVVYKLPYGEPMAGVLLAANHVSFMDIFVVGGWRTSCFVAKKEIASWPLLGWVSKRMGTLFIDRKRRRGAIEMGEQMKVTLQKGDDVMFFPEGTTGSGLALLPFHANLFEPVVQSEGVVVPIGVQYFHHGVVTDLASYANVSMVACLWQILTHSGLSCEVTILKPIEAKGETRQSLMFMTSRAIAEALHVPDATKEKEEARLAKLAQSSEVSDS